MKTILLLCPKWTIGIANLRLFGGSRFMVSITIEVTKGDNLKLKKTLNVAYKIRVSKPRR